MRHCPSSDELEDLLEEQLEPTRQEAVSSHVASCSLCQQALEQLTGDDLSLSARTVSQAVALREEPTERRAFLQQLKRQTPFALARSANGSSEAPAFPTIPGYEVLQEIGRGGMGVVYKARQEALNRLVALKMLRPGPSAGPRDRERFRREAEAVAELRHSHIVHIYDIGEVAGQPYIALEHIAGGSLSDRLHGTPQPIAASARLVETLARAMHYAHGRGIVHRDLKPANVLLVRSGFSLRENAETVVDLCVTTEPKITDFGLAKRLDDPLTRTNSGEIVGTPSYMAPEQASAGAKVGPAADLYALGAILYELLTGRPPFKGATAVDTMVQVLHEEPVRPGSLRPDLPRDLETICLTCLAKEPTRRYASAEHLAEDLARFRRGKPISARPIGPLERALKWSRRRPMTAALLVGLILVGCVGFAGVSWQWHTAAVARDTMLEEKRQKEREREQAEQARAEAARQRIQARIALYYSRISQTQLSWRVNDLASARLALKRCLPAEGEDDRRGWEWHYLRGLLHGDLFTLMHPLGGIGGAVAYSPRGGILASVLGSAAPERENGELRLWNATTGERILAQGLPPWAHRLAFSRNGEQIALAGQDGAVVIQETTSGRVLLRCKPHDEAIAALSYSPDGTRIVTASWDHKGKILDAQTGKVLAIMEGHTDKIQDLAYHPNGDQIATAGWDGTIRLWNGKGKQVGKLEGHPAAVFSVAYSPDGKLLASAAQNGNVKLWDLETGRVTQSVTGLAGAVLNVAFSPDGRYLGYGGGDATVRIWDIESGMEQAVFRGHTAPVECVDFSPDGQRLVSCSPRDGSVMVWDLTRHPEFADFARTGSDVEALVFHQDGRRLLSMTLDGRLQARDRMTGLLREEHMLAASPRVFSPGVVVSFSPDGEHVAARCRKNDAQVRIWKTSSGKELRALPLLPREAVCIRFSGDGRRLLVACPREGKEENGYEARIVKVQTGEQVVRWEGSGKFNNAVFRPGGAWLAMALSEGRIRVQTLAGNEGVELARHKGEVLTLAFNRDGTLLATAGADDRLMRIHRLTLDAESGKLAVRVVQEIAVPRRLCDLAFSPDGKRLAGICRDLVKLWDVEAGLEVLTLRGAPQRYWDEKFNPRMAFSPDGWQLAGTNWDESISLWEARRPEETGETLRRSRREAADARAVFWHLQEAEHCLQHRNPAAARFHLKRLAETPLPPPLQRRKEQVTAQLEEK